MTTSWDEVLRTCMHGVREGVDYHDCHQCQQIAKDLGWGPTWSDGKYSYFFGSQQDVDRERNKVKKK